MRIFLASLLLASLALPAAAQSRFGLGLDLLFEHQESLEVSAFRGTILTRDLLNGGEQSAEQPSDPALLNRKFDLLWELEGTGVELPINLPGHWGLDPNLVLQAGVADVSLDFIGLRDSADNAALSGRGPLFGAELEVEGSPWGSSPWSWGGSLRWQKVPSMTMDRSPAFGPEGFEVTADGVQLSQQGFEVMADDVRLSQEVQEFTLRSGYASSGSTTWYTGVRYRRTDVTIEDELGYADPFGEIETNLASRAELESKATLAIVGVETRLGKRFQGRVEAAIGEGDRIALAMVLYRPGKAPTPKHILEIAEQIRKIRAAFVSAFEALPPIVELATFEALLDSTEARLLSVFDLPEFEAIQDYIRDRFRRARELLATDSGAASMPSAETPRRRSALASLASHGLEPPETAVVRASQRVRQKTQLLGAANFIIAMLALIQERSTNDDLQANICMRSKPPQGASVALYTLEQAESARKENQAPGATQTPSKWLTNWPRGLYSYRGTLSGHKRTGCQMGTGCELDLMGPDNVLILCTFKSQSDASSDSFCEVYDIKLGRWECERDER